MEEKVGRQGKGDQNVCNEPINAPIFCFVPTITCLGHIRLSKHQYGQKNDTFPPIFQGALFE